MENNKKKIKGYAKQIKYYAGLALLGGMVLTSHTDAFAKGVSDSNVQKEQKQEQSDLEKYFTAEVPAEENEITSDSDIFKILSFYEGVAEKENGCYKVEYDPSGKLVVGSGVTLQYQQSILDYLISNGYGDEKYNTLENITNSIDQGESVYIPADLVDQEFISIIESYRNSAIEAEKEYNINFTEEQLDACTELNYRYGPTQTANLLEYLSSGGKLENFSVKIKRTLPKEQYDELNVETEFLAEEDGIVTYNAIEKPFGLLGSIEPTAENLSSIDLESTAISSNAFQYDGDYRRGLYRLLAIKNDVCLEVLDKNGDCRYFKDGNEYSTNIVDYLNAIEQESLSADDIESEFTLSESLQDDLLEDELETYIESDFDDIINTLKNEGLSQEEIENIIKQEQAGSGSIEGQEIEVDSDSESEELGKENILENENNSKSEIENSTETSLVADKKKNKPAILVTVIGAFAGIFAGLRKHEKNKQKHNKKSKTYEERLNTDSKEKAQDFKKRLQVNLENMADERKYKYKKARRKYFMLKYIEEDREYVKEEISLQGKAKEKETRNTKAMLLRYKSKEKNLDYAEKLIYNQAKRDDFLLKNPKLAQKYLKYSQEEIKLEKLKAYLIMKLNSNNKQHTKNDDGRDAI